MTKAPWIGIAFAAVWACGGGGGNTPPDAVGIDGHALADATPTTMIINGSGTGHYVTDTTVQDATVDFSRATVTSYTLAGSGFDVQTGSGTSAGTFSVPVDEGATEWDLRIGFGPNAPIHLIGNSTAPDLSSYLLGRKDQAYPTMSTPVTLSATGLAAWGTDDDLEMFSSNAGSIVFSPQAQFSTALAAGATAFTNQAIDWLANGTPLIDSSKGDVAVMYQLGTKTSGTDSYSALSKLGSVSNLTISDGQPASATFALAAVPQDESLTFTWKRSMFDALSTEGGPGAGTPIEELLIDALPGATARGAFSSAAPDLVEFIDLPEGATDLTETFTYGNPFVTGSTKWDEYVAVYYLFTVNR